MCCYRFDTYLFDPEAGHFYGPEGEIRLRPQAFHVLRELVEQHPKIIPHDDLLDRVWGAAHISANSLPQVISELRQVLEDSAQAPRFIETIHRRGYRFIGPLEKVSPPTVEVASPPPEAEPKRGTRVLPWLVLLLALGILAFNPWHGASAARDQRPQVEPRLAVLDMLHVGGAGEQAWMGLAIAEMLARELGRAEGIRVLPLERVARLEADLDLAATEALSGSALQQIERRLGADLVLVGSFLRTGPGRKDFRLDLRVQETRTQATIKHLQHTGEARSWPELVARAGEELRDHFGESSRTTRDFGMVREAVRPYFEARRAQRLFDPRAAQEWLEQAAVLDPDSAAVQLALSRVCEGLGDELGARRAAEQALRLGRSLPEDERLVLAARHHALAGRRHQAVASLQPLYDRRPENLEVGLLLGEALVRTGQGRRALELLEGLRGRPLHAVEGAWVDLEIARAALAISELDLAVQAARRAAGAAEDSGALLLLAEAWFIEGEARRHLGELELAGRRLEQAYFAFLKRGDGQFAARALGAYGRVVAEAGDLEAGREHLERALAESLKTGNRRLAADHRARLADIDLRQGRHESARQGLDRALASYLEAGDRAGAASVHLQLADLLSRSGELARAAMLIDRARRDSQEIGDRRGEAEAWNLEGSIAGRTGGFDEAERAFGRALGLYREIGDQRGTADALGHLASVDAGRGRLDLAERQYAAALELHRQQVNRRGVSKVSYNLALIHVRLGRLVDARRLLESSLAGFEDLGEERNACWVRRKLGDVMMEQGEIEPAAEILEAALARCREVGSRSGEGHALASLGTLAARRGDLEAAESWLRQARAMRQELGQDGNAAVDGLALARLALDAGRLDEAEALVREAGRSMVFNGPGWRALYLALSARLDAARGRTRAAVVALDEAELLAKSSENLNLVLNYGVERGRTLQAAGRIEKARDVLRAVAERAASTGFVALALEAEAFLKVS